MTERSDYYAVLGLERTARPEEIKGAWRRLVKRLHPDRNRNPAAGDRLRAVNTAYEVLSDPGRRVEYDLTLPSVRTPVSQTQGRTGLAEGLGMVIGGLATEIGRRWNLGQDLRYTIELTLAEACLGCQKEIVFEAPVRCGACAGKGEASGAPCAGCGGEGVVARERTFEVKVPPGTVPGKLTRIAKAGVPGAQGGPEGDLFLAVDIRPHPLLTRDAQDLRCRAPVPVTLALSGGEIRVPTLTGTSRVEVPPNVQNGQTLRLPGHGVPRPDGTRGDLLIAVEVEMPLNLPESVVALLVEATRGSPDASYPRTAAFLAALRGLEESR